MTNHPVHVQDEDGNLSPTALIPFCEFGGNFSVVGVKIKDFDIPFCNGFREKIIDGQLCYTIDLNDRRLKEQFDEKDDLSFKLFISYNEDRQMDNSVDLSMNMSNHEDDSPLAKYVLLETIDK